MIERIVIYEKENVSLFKLKFNGIIIDSKIKEEMKNTVCDSSYLYEYKNIGINVDNNDYINYLEASILKDSINTIIRDISDANIYYNDKKLETSKDFKEYFGKGNKIKSKCDNDSYYIEYYDQSLELSLYIKNDKLYSVALIDINSY